MRAASNWFDQNWEQYPSDGVPRVHRNHARARDAVDWTLERERYPYLGTVIETEINGEPPARIKYLADAEDLTEGQRQDIWFRGLTERGDTGLRDSAEEDLLSARPKMTMA